MAWCKKKITTTEMLQRIWVQGRGMARDKTGDFDQSQMIDDLLLH